MADHDPTTVDLLARELSRVATTQGVRLYELRGLLARAALEVLDAAGRLLPDGGQTREEWGVWWHAATTEGIRLSEYQLRSREAAIALGHERIGEYGIKGFTTVRRIHTWYETGDWVTRWERVGDPIGGPWEPVPDTDRGEH